MRQCDIQKTQADDPVAVEEGGATGERGRLSARVRIAGSLACLARLTPERRALGPGLRIRVVPA